MAITTKYGLTLMSSDVVKASELFNEATLVFDALVNATALSATDTAPPASPALGDLYLLPAGCSGAWAGHDQDIAIYVNGWRFLAGPLGAFVWVVDQAKTFKLDAVTGTWVEHITGSDPILAALNPKVIVSDLLATPPISPNVGACYIVAPSATGDWTGWEGTIASYIGGSWVQITPKEGWVFWVQNKAGRYVYTSSVWVALIEEAPKDGTAYARQDGAWVVASVTGGIHDLPLSYAGTPTASEVMHRFTVVRDVACPINFAGSAGHVGANPTASFAIDVQAAGVSIGTITIDTAGALTFATTGGLAQVVAAGSLVTFHAPAAVDATITDISVTLLGSA